MSEPIIKTAVSALNLVRYDGIALVEDCGLQGMITLRGDLALRAVKAAATGASGMKMPTQGQANIDGENGLCWMSPDEVLILCPYCEVATREQALTKKLGATHSLAVNVSDARAILRVSGPNAREVLAKLCPVDLSVEGFSPGMFRRTRMAQVPAAFWMDNETTFRIVCFRSVVDYMFNLLKTASQPGSEVGYF